MKLKHLNNYLDFMDAVDSCEGDVYYHSVDGDRLNLRSALCQYLFATLFGDRAYLHRGEIVCAVESDYQRLSAFLLPT